jgi:tRNA wybutosine-synthesizing protein 3
LKCGLQAGFRESGAVSLLESTAKTGHVEPATPMVAIRSMGLSFESLVGEMDGLGRKRSLVSNEYLRMLVAIANERFVENRKRIGRFLDALRIEIGGAGEVLEEGRGGRSEKELRRESKRAEGLSRQAEARKGREEKPVEEHEQEVDDTVEYTALP